MPKTELHQKQKRKNYTLLVIILAVIAATFFVSIIKMSGK